MSSKTATEAKPAMHYFSRVKGISGGFEDGILYRGVMFRVSAECAPGSKEHLAIEDMYDPLVIFQPDDESEPLPGGTIERYEVFDIETRGMIVMYRMPYREKGGKR